MVIVKTTRQQENIKNFGYKKEKRLQFVRNYKDKEGYIENIKNTFKTLSENILYLIIMPFSIIASLILFLLSFNNFFIVYTKKDIKDESLVLESTFNDEWELEE